MINHQAIYNTHSNVKSISGEDSVEAFDVNGNPVVLDQSAVDVETARLQAEQDSQAYARNRQAEYPSIDELVVAMWEGVVEERMASVTALEGLRQAIKTKYPKV
jgi:hypothetical protein